MVFSLRWGALPVSEGRVVSVQSQMVCVHPQQDICLFHHRFTFDVTLLAGSFPFSDLYRTAMCGGFN
jgi:hypothetical protein